MNQSQQIIEVLKDDRDVLQSAWEAKPGGLLRKLMGADEIQRANRLVKAGYLETGTSDDKQKTRHFVLTAKGEDFKQGNQNDLA